MQMFTASLRNTNVIFKYRVQNIVFFLIKIPSIMYVSFTCRFLANERAENLTFESPKRATSLQHGGKGRKTQEKIFRVIAFKSTAETTARRKEIVKCRK